MNGITNKVYYHFTLEKTQQAYKVFIKELHSNLNNIMHTWLAIFKLWFILQSSRQFTERIETYLAHLHNYTTHKITKEIGKCRSLWEIFHSFRFITCKLIVDPLVIKLKFIFSVIRFYLTEWYCSVVFSLNFDISGCCSYCGKFSWTLQRT